MQHFSYTQNLPLIQEQISEPWDTLRASVLAIRASRKQAMLDKADDDLAFSNNPHVQMFGELELALLRSL